MPVAKCLRCLCRRRKVFCLVVFVYKNLILFFIRNVWACGSFWLLCYFLVFLYVHILVLFFFREVLLKFILALKCNNFRLKFRYLHMLIV
jgi:hypothetical protein